MPSASRRPAPQALAVMRSARGSRLDTLWHSPCILRGEDHSHTSAPRPGGCHDDHHHTAAHVSAPLCAADVGHRRHRRDAPLEADAQAWAAPRPVSRCIPHKVSRGSWGMVRSTPGIMEEGRAVFLDSSSRSAWTMGGEQVGCQGSAVTPPPVDVASETASHVAGAAHARDVCRGSGTSACPRTLCSPSPDGACRRGDPRREGT